MIELLITIGGRLFALAALALVLYLLVCVVAHERRVAACSDTEDEGAAWDRERDRWLDEQMGVAS
ncbi:hypothetical protein AB0H71_13960 [Nocardia sp. NPDC050697]|uniref:hypothetical protein n=1 Tax=Nocardia sp. NPDC050697 TaxID=3155158 RepID=UPI0033E5F406